MMNASKLWLIASVVGGVGGWMITLPNWAAALAPVSMGGLLTILGAVVCAWLGKSPLKPSGQMEPPAK